MINERVLILYKHVEKTFAALDALHHFHDAEIKGSGSASASKTLIWGPGLETNIVLPARFFFIQTVDSTGRK